MQSFVHRGDINLNSFYTNVWDEGICEQLSCAEAELIIPQMFLVGQPIIPDGTQKPKYFYLKHLFSKGLLAMRKSVILILLLFFIAPLSASAGEIVERIRKNNELILGTPGDFPPFTAVTSQGQIIGFDIDLANNLAKAMNVKLTIKQYPFDSLITALTNKEVDFILSGITMTPERNLHAAFIGPYGSTGQAFFGKHELLGAISSPKDLNSEEYTYAVLKGSTSEITATTHLSKAKIIHTQTLDESVILLLKGKIDGLISDYPFCKLLEYRYGKKGFSLMDRIVTRENLGIGISGDDFHFANIIENYITTLKTQGIIDKMEAYWFQNDSWIQELPDLEFFKDM